MLASLFHQVPTYFMLSFNFIVQGTKKNCLFYVNNINEPKVAEDFLKKLRTSNFFHENVCFFNISK